MRRLIRLHDEMHAMLARYAVAERRAGRGWIAVMDAERAVEVANAPAADAEDELDARVRRAYQFGPGGAIEALLNAGSFADAAAISDYTARTISLRSQDLGYALVAQAVVVARQARAEASRAALEPKLEKLRRMLTEMRAVLDEATRLARRASIRATRSRPSGRRWRPRPRGWGPGTSSATGTTRARCWRCSARPAGGPATRPRAWSRPARRSTATRRGTGGSSAASRRRPARSSTRGCSRRRTAGSRSGRSCGSRTGGRCAIVLVNDRGPYGNEERVIDLSEAAAKYLGVGVSYVHADILVPDLGGRLSALG